MSGVMVRYRSCSVMRCEDKFSSRHRFSDAANNLNLFQKVGVNEALINIPTEQIFHKPSSTSTTGNVGVNIVKMLGINKWEIMALVPPKLRNGDATATRFRYDTRRQHVVVPPKQRVFYI
ncbi:hypothetical protein NQ317_008139 [Molorchus minor]|uniref:Uncharacterized protein n=1 Tax=Molorchus minor TaxID=1323400 RepID=A0ABQ9JK09_9CUCU|nr:hypothetical protein NQ317_008139 [Molorchus minor]